MNIVYFILSSLCWGFAWYAVRIQGISDVPVAQTTGYRFFIVSLLIYLFCRIRKISATYTWRQHVSFAIQGLCLCSINFSLYCLAMKYIPSGLVSIGCATLVFMNAINSRLFLGMPISLQTILGGSIGFIGMVLVFTPYLGSLQSMNDGMLGLMYCLISTYILSIGNTLARYTNSGVSGNVLRNAVPMMFYGCIFSFIISFAQGESLKISFAPEYIGALFYLVVFGSIIGLVSFLQLIQTIGSDKAAYAMMVSPVIALVVSSSLEGLNLTFISVMGVVLVLAGCIVVLTKFNKKDTLNTHIKKAA